MTGYRFTGETMTDGETLNLAVGDVQPIACCDCGLVHDWEVVRASGGMVTLRLKLDPKATTRIRRSERQKKR